MADSNEKKTTKYNSIYLYLVYGIAGMIIVLYFLIIYTYVRMQINDNLRINFGGRLRMLTQEITKDVILFRDGNVGKIKIENSIIVFNDSIQAIAHGGMIPSNIRRTAFKRVSPMNDLHSHKLMDQAIAEWEPFRYHVISFLERKDGDSFRYVLKHNEKLLNMVDRAVLAIEVHANHDQRVLLIVIASGIAIVFVALVYNFMAQLKEYRRASSRLAEIELLLPICSNCKKIRTDNEHPFDPHSWITIEEYLLNKKDMVFTHSICPSCMTKLYPDMHPEKDKKKES